MLDVYKRIKDLRLAAGLSQGELAKRTGYNDRSSIAKIEAGKVDLTQSKIAVFAHALNTTPAYLMGWEGQERTAPTIPAGFEPLPEMTTIPLVGSIACGTPITAEENIEARIGIPAAWNADFALTCKGDSMAPKICDGDIVCIRKQQEVENGEIAAVRIGEEATLKRFYRQGDTVLLQAENPTFTPLVYANHQLDEIAIEGKAVGFCRGL